MNDPQIVFVPKTADIKEDRSGIHITCDGKTQTFPLGSVVISNGDILQDWTDIPDRVCSKIVGDALVTLRKSHVEMIRLHKEQNYSLNALFEELMFTQIALKDLSRAIESKDDLKIKRALENHETTIEKAKGQWS